MKMTDINVHRPKVLLDGPHRRRPRFSEEDKEIIGMVLVMLFGVFAGGCAGYWLGWLAGVATKL